MQIPSTDYANLCAVTYSRKLLEIPNQVMRKPMPKSDQNQLGRNSVCIVCSYKFKDEPLESWSKKIRAICHPFKDASFFPKKKKRFLLSESDFADQLCIKIEMTMRILHMTIAKELNVKVYTFFRILQKQQNKKA